MTRRLLMIAALLVVGATTLHAQTYQQSAVKVCLGSTHANITDFSQFDCRGVLYGSIEWFVPEFEIFTPNWSISSLHSSLTVLSFTTPANGNDGTFSFVWSGTDMSGVFHNGTVTNGQWRELVDWRGWHHAVIDSSTLTIIQ